VSFVHILLTFLTGTELTGASQLAALLAAPIVGYLSDSFRRFNLPLITGALFGVLSYLAFGLLKSPEPSGEDGSPAVFIIVIFIGFSQISAIVCSLGILGQRIQASTESEFSSVPADSSNSTTSTPRNDDEDDEPATEEAPLLIKPYPEDGSRAHLKGSIAGIYSLSGGAGILLLTKAGGYLFDTLSPAAPFYLLAAFNAVLLATGILCGLASELERRRISREQRP
jgi:MFS family permease